ncbi:MAG: nuclease-related domain-containing protein [Halobacteriota archaeon]
MKVLKETNYEYMEVKIKRNRKLALLSFLVCFILFLLTFIFPLSLYGSFIALAFALSYLGRNFSWKKGMLGEKEVTITLKGLDDSYYLLNDVVLYPKHGNIDHIVLGQNGIFVIETKNYKGEVGCKEEEWYLLTYPAKKRGGGRRKRPVKKPLPSISKQAKRNATTLKSFIEKHIDDINLKTRQIEVNSIVAFVDPNLDLKLRKPTVEVLRAFELPKFIKKVKTDNRFSDDELKAFGDIILKYSVK